MQTAVVAVLRTEHKEVEDACLLLRLLELLHSGGRPPLSRAVPERAGPSIAELD